MSATVRKVDDGCSDTGRLKVTVAVRKAHDRVGIPHVDPLWIRAGGIKGDAVRLVEICREHLGVLGLTVRGQSAESADLPAAAFRDEDITVRSHTYDARCRETVRVELDLEALGSFWPRVGRPGDHGRYVSGGVGRKRLRQIADRDHVHRTWLLEPEISERCRWRRRSDGCRDCGNGCRGNDRCPHQRLQVGNELPTLLFG